MRHRVPVAARVLACVLFACAALAPAASAQSVAVPRGLPEGTVYDPAIPTPASVLGYEVGDWHVRPDLIRRYLEALAAASDRVTLEEYARTHEARPLLLATITSAANHSRLEDIRQRHVAVARGEMAPGPDRPVVAWLGYSVHGNEPSGANASLLVAYHLAAATGPDMDALLADTVILLDPVINPDGLARFAHWANMHKGKQLVSEGWHKEHREAWPGGRTNHYWFDLNRDWLLLTHPESRGRITQFHRWKPNLLTDHHEMGTSSTFFFQPGVPSRQNPRTPAGNLPLTRAIAGYHAADLDAQGRLYYTEESFDDFYYGKGSSYPDVQGSIGILFEQASSRGHLQENAWGELAFPETIRNQVTTSLSSLRAAHELRDDLLGLQADAVRTAREEAAADAVAAYVFGHPRDAVRAAALADILRRHDIAVHPLRTGLEHEGVDYAPGHAYVVPCDQPQYRLVKSVFERRTEFEDDTFYDVSTWVLPLAFGLDHAELSAADFGGADVDLRLTAAPPVRGSVDRDGPAPDLVAYAFEWHGHHAPRALVRLQEHEIVAQVATRPFTGTTPAGERDFDYGTILVPVGPQPVTRAELHLLMEAVARDDGLAVHTLTSGLTPEGLDLGSPSARPLEAPKPVIVVGGGASSYEAGEVWHQLDARWRQPVALVDGEDLGAGTLADVTHLLLVNGATSFSDSQVEDIKTWVRRGGVVVATRGAARWAGRELLGEDGSGSRLRDRDDDEDDDGDGNGDEDDEPEDDPAYADYERDRARTLVSGTIFETRLDRTHPLAYGYVRETLPVFRSGTSTMAPGRDPYADAFLYTDEPRLSGYANQENIDEIAGTVAATAKRLGGGTVVRIADDPLFRGFWYGTQKLYANALYFGGIIKSTRAVGEEEEAGEAVEEHEH